MRQNRNITLREQTICRFADIAEIFALSSPGLNSTSTQDDPAIVNALSSRSALMTSEP